MNMGKLDNIQVRLGLLKNGSKVLQQEMFDTPIDAQTTYLLEQLKQWLRAGIDRRGERFVRDMFMVGRMKSDYLEHFLLASSRRRAPWLLCAQSRRFD